MAYNTFGTPVPGAPTYFTNLFAVGVTNLETTFTHGLSITPGILKCQVIIHQAAVTATAPVGYGTLGTSVVTVFSGVGTLVTVDVIVWQQPEIVH